MHEVLDIPPTTITAHPARFWARPSTKRQLRRSQVHRISNEMSNSRGEELPSRAIAASNDTQKNWVHSIYVCVFSAGVSCHGLQTDTRHWQCPQRKKGIKGFREPWTTWQSIWELVPVFGSDRLHCSSRSRMFVQQDCQLKKTILITPIILNQSKRVLGSLRTPLPRCTERTAAVIYLVCRCIRRKAYMHNWGQKVFRGHCAGLSTS